jgi:hypothetical protein
MPSHSPILLVSFPSVSLLSQVTPDLYRTTFFGPGPSVDALLRESSNGAVSATGDVFGPFTLDADYYDQPYAIRDAAIRMAAASRTVDFTRYNRLVLVVPQSSAVGRVVVDDKAFTIAQAAAAH